MQIAHLAMTQFWSTDSALCERPSPHSYMLMSKVKAEAVPCLQVGLQYSTCRFMHSHTVMHFTSQLHRDNNTAQQIIQSTLHLIIVLRDIE